mgnify:CR=1 FL=1
MAKVKPKPPRRKRKNKTKEHSRERSASWIELMTAKDAKWWVAKVQTLIAKHSKPTKNPWHGTTKTGMVIAELTNEVQKTFPRKGPAYDGNMRMASVLSYVLAVFYLRLHRAKSYDPRRPVKARQAAYWSRLHYATALFMAVVDESMDAEMFPGQNWESPWDPRTTDGYFV